MRILCVGAGLSGAVIGRRLAEAGHSVTVMDARDHVAGNCHTERDADSGGRGGGSGWSVNLAFQFDTIGTLQCRIGLSDERVATTFWCETPATHARVEERLPVLRQALEAQGLEVVHLTGMVGESGVPLIHIPMPDSLLDERA